VTLRVFICFIHYFLIGIVLRGSILFNVTRSLDSPFAVSLSNILIFRNAQLFQRKHFCFVYRLCVTCYIIAVNSGMAVSPPLKKKINK